MSSTKKKFGSVRQIVSKVAVCLGGGGGGTWGSPPPTNSNPDFKSLWFEQCNVLFFCRMMSALLPFFSPCIQTKYEKHENTIFQKIVVVIKTVDLPETPEGERLKRGGSYDYKERFEVCLSHFSPSKFILFFLFFFFCFFGKHTYLIVFGWKKIRSLELNKQTNCPNLSGKLFSQPNDNTVRSVRWTKSKWNWEDDILDICHLLFVFI